MTYETRIPSPTYHWYLRSSNVQELEMIIVLENDVSHPHNIFRKASRVVFIKFDTLPSSVQLDIRYGNSSFHEDEYDDDEILTILTDGHICEGGVAPSSLLKQSGFCYVPLGKRYGAFQVSKNNALIYQKEFWKFPNALDHSISTCISKPQMINVSKRELCTACILI